MTAPSSPPALVDLAASRDGHRGEYADFLIARLGATALPWGPAAFATRAPVLVPMIEESFSRFVMLALARAVLARRTAGLLFRPLPAIEGGTLRLRIKRAMLRLLRAIGAVQVLTILPFALDPRFARIADGWIHDLMLWDWGGAAPPPPGPLARAITAAAAGRARVIAIGRQDRAKGFDRFAGGWTARARLRETTLFAFGGKVADECGEALVAFAAADGFALDRFVTAAELDDLYAAADWVWCGYAADYDQASGILGRALQRGIPVVVRRGSLLERMCLAEHAPHLALGLDEADDGGWEALAQPPAHEDPAVTAARTARFERESLAALRAALGLVDSAALANAARV